MPLEAAHASKGSNGEFSPQPCSCLTESDSRRLPDPAASTEDGGSDKERKRLAAENEALRTLLLGFGVVVST